MSVFNNVSEFSNATNEEFQQSHSEIARHSFFSSSAKTEKESKFRSRQNTQIVEILNVLTELDTVSNYLGKLNLEPNIRDSVFQSDSERISTRSEYDNEVPSLTENNTRILPYGSKELNGIMQQKIKRAIEVLN